MDALEPLFDSFRQFGPAGSEIADRYEVVKTADIPYGKAVNFLGDSAALSLDLFQPADDGRCARPLFVLSRVCLLSSHRSQIHGRSTTPSPLLARVTRWSAPVRIDRWSRSGSSSTWSAVVVTVSPGYTGTPNRPLA